MKEDNRDGGLMAGAVTLLDSSQQATPAKRSLKPTRDVPPTFPQRKARDTRPTKRHRGDSRVSPSKKQSASKQLRSEAPEARDHRISAASSGARTESSAKLLEKDVNDPHLLAMVEIELMRAELRVYFLNTYPVLDAKAVHRQAGCKGADETRKARNWRSAGRIIGLPIVGSTVYPAFQFQSNGQPYPLIRKVNSVFRKDCTDWHRATWLVSPNERLDGETPLSAIQRNDPMVVEAATHAYEVPVG